MGYYSEYPYQSYGSPPQRLTRTPEQVIVALKLERQRTQRNNRLMVKMQTSHLDTSISLGLSLT